MSNAVVERASNSRVPAVLVTGATGISGGMDIRGYRKGSVLIPAAWVGADMTFLSADGDDESAALRGQATLDGQTSDKAPAYGHVRTAAASAALLRVLNIPTSGGGWMPLPAALFEGHAFIKARSTNTASEAVVDQTADRTLIFRFSS